MTFKRAPRLNGFDYTGIHRYSLTICTVDRCRAFVSLAAIAPLLVQIQHAADAAHFAVIAYCFMPDHLHLLVEGRRDDADLRWFVKILKQRTSYAWKQNQGSELWQRGYYDRVLRDEEATIDVARYIVANPVRAGIVESPQDYGLIGSFTMRMQDLLYSLQ